MRQWSIRQKIELPRYTGHPGESVSERIDENSLEYRILKKAAAAYKKSDPDLKDLALEN